MKEPMIVVLPLPSEVKASFNSSRDTGGIRTTAETISPGRTVPKKYIPCDSVTDTLNRRESKSKTSVSGLSTNTPSIVSASNVFSHEIGQPVNSVNCRIPSRKLQLANLAVTCRVSFSILSTTRSGVRSNLTSRMEPGYCGPGTRTAERTSVQPTKLTNIKIANNVFFIFTKIKLTAEPIAK
jgi:hypothetical protein